MWFEMRHPTADNIATLQSNLRFMRDSFYKNTSDLIRFILRESDLLRSPVLIFVIVASASRTAMIFLINEAAESGGADLRAFLMLAGTAVAMLASTYWAKMTGTILVERMTRGMRLRITKRILEADVSFFQSQPYGEVYHASTSHTGYVAAAVLVIVDFIQAVLLLAFCLAYMLLQMPASAAVAFIALTLGASAFFLTEGPAARAAKASHQAIVAFHNSVHDLLRGYKELRLRRERRDDLSKQVDAQVDEAQSLSVKAERYFNYGQLAATGSLSLLLISIVSVLPLAAGSDSVTILQILTLVLFSFGPIESMVGSLPDMARAALSLRIFRGLEDELRLNAERLAPGRGLDSRPAFRSLELRGVTARLTREAGGDASGKDEFMLGPVNLTLLPGQSVFITGGNGSGKSTLLQLLTGLRHPESGGIFLDGAEITRENISEYRNVFSAVFSEFHMFRHLYGLTPEERAKLDGNIKEMGLAEGVSITGSAFDSLSLSTGQMRRLALSIALAEERPIIVLDEFAADQDPERRAFFYDVLVPRLAQAGHCIVAVTHDEHCFSKCDRLVRMEYGRIVSDSMQSRTARTSQPTPA